MVEQTVPDEVIEYADDAFTWYNAYQESNALVGRLKQQVEDLESHIAAIQDGLDQELFG